MDKIFYFNQYGVVLTPEEVKAEREGNLLPGEKYTFSEEEQKELSFSLDGEEWAPVSVERLA